MPLDYHAMQPKIRDIEQQLRLLGYKGFVIAVKQSPSVHRLSDTTIAVRADILEQTIDQVVNAIRPLVADERLAFAPDEESRYKALLRRGTGRKGRTGKYVTVIEEKPKTNQQ